MNINIPHFSIKSFFSKTKTYGDLTSSLWKEIGYQHVQADLLSYYQANEDQIPVWTYKTPFEREKYKDRREEDLGNCFSYAFGFLTSSNDNKPNVYSLSCLNFDNMADQSTVINIMDFISYRENYLINQNTFLKNLADLKILPLSQLNQREKRDINPVISLVRPNRDYHFIKPDIYKTPKGPKVVFTDKNGPKEISKDFSLEEFVESYEEISGLYKEPVALGAPKTFLNRELNMTTIGFPNVQITFSAPKKFCL